MNPPTLHAKAPIQNVVSLTQVRTGNVIGYIKDADDAIVATFNGLAGTTRLLTAAYNSYARHFGRMAVEAAEADRLGSVLASHAELVTECNRLRNYLHLLQPNVRHDTVDAALANAAKLGVKQ